MLGDHLVRQWGFKPEWFVSTTHIPNQHSILKSELLQIISSETKSNQSKNGTYTVISLLIFKGFYFPAQTHITGINLDIFHSYLGTESEAQRGKEICNIVRLISNGAKNKAELPTSSLCLAAYTMILSS